MIRKSVMSQNDLEDSEIQYHLPTQKAPWYDQILLNRPLKVTVIFTLVAVVAPLLIYTFYFFTTFDLPPSDGYSVGTCLVQRENRIPCGNGSMISEDCHPQCCYDLSANFCFHRLPSRFSYIMDQMWKEDTTLYPRIATVPYHFQNSLTSIKLSIDEITETHLILRLYDPRVAKFTGRRLNETKYKYEVSSPEMSITINATQGTIFNMARGPLIASDNIWEISFILTNESMYGLGEIPLKVNTTKILYNHDGGISSVPLVYAKINDTYHAILFESIEPTEISVRGENRIVVRSITSSGLTFHVFVGPTPADVMNDVSKVIGTKFDIDYWMLGVHVCNEVPDEDLSSFIANAIQQGLPYDSLCGHGHVTFDSDLCGHHTCDEIEAAASILRSSNKRFLPHVSPFIRLDRLEGNLTESEEVETRDASCNLLPLYESVMYRDHHTSLVYEGLVGKYPVIYPRYSLASTELMSALWRCGVIPDGMVLSNDWPLDQSEKKLNETGLPYFSEDIQKAFNNTPPWDLVLKHHNHTYLSHHNKYGDDFAKAASHLVNRSAIWSSSQWMNGGVGINRQNIETSWTNLNKELVNAALGGVSGHWFWSSPICGDTPNFNKHIHEDLCVKWYMAATYLPMIKIHSVTSPRYPMAFAGTHRARMTEALNHRLSLLPYFFTTLQIGPLLRPMFYQYPASQNLSDSTSQYNIGDDLLIVPNLQPRQSHVHVWMPPGTWYEFWSGLRLNGTEGKAVTMTTTDADFLTLVRGGSILALQKNTEHSAESTRRASNYTVLIALECQPACQATGRVFITNNLTLQFTATNETLTISADGDGFDAICSNSSIAARYVTEISVYGLSVASNTHDHHRHVVTSINMCTLITDENILHRFT